MTTSIQLPLWLPSFPLADWARLPWRFPTVPVLNLSILLSFSPIYARALLFMGTESNSLNPTANTLVSHQHPVLLPMSANLVNGLCSLNTLSLSVKSAVTDPPSPTSLTMRTLRNTRHFRDVKPPSMAYFQLLFDCPIAQRGPSGLMDKALAS